MVFSGVNEYTLYRQFRGINIKIRSLSYMTDGLKTPMNGLSLSGSGTATPRKMGQAAIPLIGVFIPLAGGLS
jgi:hypothetical protein